MENTFSPKTLKISCDYFDKQSGLKLIKKDVWFDVISNKLCICWNGETLEQIIIDADIAETLLNRIKQL